MSIARWALEPEVAAQADQVRDEIALELGQLGDLPGAHQLAQPGVDPGPDPPQLTAATGGDELGDAKRRVANRLRGAAVGAQRVRVGVTELEDRGERVEPVGDLGVVHRRAAVQRRRRAARATRARAARSRSRLTTRP